MQTHELIEPFDIDDGSLDDVSPREAFALGVEWAMFWQRIKSGEPFRDLCLANNANRLEKLAGRRGRFSEAQHTPARGWAGIWVGSAIGCEPPAPESK